ncbi:hypothetical protein EON80_32820, partial [bacterium]
IYGKPISSAEAFTDLKFSQSLAEAKNVADYAFAFGAQEFVVCASAYQPWLDKIPGSTGGGRQYVLNRNNTYWNYSRPFWDYQARCAALMRNGISVADICIYLGEDAPVKLLAYRLPEIPEGYDFDVFTKDALMNRLDSKNGKIILPDGVSYKILVLQRGSDLSLDALRKISDLVKGGVIVYGAPPAPRCGGPPYKPGRPRSRPASSRRDARGSVAARGASCAAPRTETGYARPRSPYRG